MKSKAPLSLMEQMVMILVFALAAALCLQAFVKSDAMSKDSEAQDRAAVLCQSAAEAVRACQGNFEAAAQKTGAAQYEKDSFQVFYDVDWQLSAASSPNVYPFGYTLGAARQASDIPGLGKASVWVQSDETGEELFRLEVCWQEVSGHE